MHSRFGRYAVDDIQGVVVVQRADTPYAHRGRSRWGTVGGNVHPGNLALQRFHGIVVYRRFYVRHGNHRHRTGEVGFTLGSITGNH